MKRIITIKEIKGEDDRISWAYSDEVKKPDNVSFTMEGDCTWIELTLAFMKTLNTMGYMITDKILEDLEMNDFRLGDEPEEEDSIEIDEDWLANLEAEREGERDEDDEF